MDKKLKIKKTIRIAVIALFALILVCSSFYTINEQEQAVVVTFGVPKTVSEPGLHFKWPFVQHVRMVDTTIKGFAIGYYEGTTESNVAESLMITSDFNFVNVDFYVEYRVIDPILYLYASENPVEILKMITQGNIRSVVGQTDVDSIITTGKGQAQALIKEKIVEELEEDNLGIQLVNITIQDAEPPTAEVLEAFTAVEAAKQGKETAVNNAKKYSNEQLPAAEAQADQVIKAAEAQKEARINEATGQAARFDALFNEYKNYPLITKKRMYYESMMKILPDLEVIVNSGDNGTDDINKLLILEGGR